MANPIDVSISESLFSELGFNRDLNLMLMAAAQVLSRIRWDHRCHRRLRQAVLNPILKSSL
jgi:hypothetical protein